MYLSPIARRQCSSLFSLSRDRLELVSNLPVVNALNSLPQLMRNFINKNGFASGLLIEKVLPNEVRPLGSGTVVKDAFSFLTAKHCFYGVNSDQLFVRFIRPDNTIDDVKVKHILNANNNLDATLLTLEKPQSTFLTVKSTPFDDGRYAMFHFAGGKNQLFSTGDLHESTPYLIIKPSLFIDAGPGASGAAILDVDGEVVGINIYRFIEGGNVKRFVIPASDLGSLFPDISGDSFFPDPISHPTEKSLFLQNAQDENPSQGWEVYSAKPAVSKRWYIGDRCLFFRRMGLEEFKCLQRVLNDEGGVLKFSSLLTREDERKWFSTSFYHSQTFENANYPENETCIVRFSLKKKNLSMILGDMHPHYQKGAVPTDAVAIHQERISKSKKALTDSAQGIMSIFKHNEDFNAGLSQVALNRLGSLVLKVSRLGSASIPDGDISFKEYKRLPWEVIWEKT